MGVRLWLLLAACAMLLAACAHESAPPQALVLPEPSSQGPSAVVVVSVAGLTPDLYRAANSPMPTLAALAEGGASADAVHSVAPASSYPAHATLSTGRRPAGHGVVANHRLGERGVGHERYSGAAELRAPTLWRQAALSGLRVATLGWPSTVGAKVASNLPDVEPTRSGESWLDALRHHTDARMIALADAAGARAPEVALPGAARDRLLIDVACRLMEDPRPPQLLFVHLAQSSAALRSCGAGAREARAAFARVDQELARLVTCTHAQGRLADTTIVAVGDHGVMSVHTRVSPNAALAEAGLLTPIRNGQGMVQWDAVTRSNGGSAFVYARKGEDAVLARRALERKAEQTGAFRVVTAQEMKSLGADPDAWFGLEAEPGFVFSNDARGPFLRAAATRGVGGYLPGHREMDAGFVAWGPGIARGLRIPVMELTDVAPTLAPLLGLSLDGVEGRVLVGVLRLPRVSAMPER